jgi:hypothetical protein
MKALNESLMEREVCLFHRISRPPDGRQVQPPDAENRMSGGVGGVTGAIPSPRPAHPAPHSPDAEPEPHQTDSSGHAHSLRDSVCVSRCHCQ